MLKTLQIMLITALMLSSCDFFDFQKKTNIRFADQHFKTAIAHIELYKIRYGHYPETLAELSFLGDWDKGIQQNVSYEKLDTGYRLDIIKKISGGTLTELQYPKAFWQGTGVKKSNLLNQNQ